MTSAKNKTVLAIMFFAVVVSGCTGGGSQEETSSTASVQVNEFSAFPNPTPSGQKTRFRMQLKNAGGSDATDTYVRLYNPPFGSGSNPGDKTWRDSDEGGVQTKERTLYFGELSAPSDQTPAVPKTQTVTFTAPNLDPDRTISYDMNAYIMYQYNTSASSQVQIMGGDKYRAEGSPSGSASLDNSRGPIKMEIRTPTPIVFYDVGDQSTLERELCVIVRNQGSGVPFAADKSGVFKGGEDDGVGYNLDKVQEHENKVLVDIEDIGSVDFEPYDDLNPQKTVQILSGKGVQCWGMQVDVGNSAQVQETVPLSLTATYGYRKSTRTSVSVEGRR
jgi:hypothetical protein